MGESHWVGYGGGGDRGPGIIMYGGGGLNGGDGGLRNGGLGNIGYASGGG